MSRRSSATTSRRAAPAEGQGGGGPPRYARDVKRPALALALVLAATPAHAAEWIADASASRLIIHAFRAGALRALGHDHHFLAGRWRASATFDPDRLEGVHGTIVVGSDSLHDTQGALDDSDRAKVDRQTRDEVLDAAKFPDIRYDVEGFERAAGAASGPTRGTLHGTLALHGAKRPLDVPIEIAPREGGGFTARGRGSVRLGDFGMRPPRAVLGAVTVKDVVEVEIDLALVPRR